MLMYASACSDDNDDLLPDETFEILYGDVLFLGELYRGDSTLIRRSIDSLLQAHGTDTTTFFATAETYAQDREKMQRLYSKTIERFEKLSGSNDSLQNTRDIGTHPEDY